MLKNEEQTIKNIIEDLAEYTYSEKEIIVMKAMNRIAEEENNNMEI